MNAADYTAWCRYAGIYLANHSHSERYRTYQQKLSNAGLVTRIVDDFLGDNEGGLDLQSWRSMAVYEVGACATFRVEQTALALEAIGAPRVAAKVRTVKDTSLGGMILGGGHDPQRLREMMTQIDPAKLLEEFRANVARALPGHPGVPVPEKKPVPPDAEIEPWEQVEHLLVRYVQAHQQDLRADLEKFGDPRTTPGFDPKKRLEELDRLHRRELDREAQLEHVREMRHLMEQLGKQLSRNPDVKPGKVAAPRRQFLECYRRYARRPADELLPATREWLQQAERFQEQYARVFRPLPTEDKHLLERLAAVGPHDVDLDGRRVTISWDSPRGLACDWATFSLTLGFPAKKKNTLRHLLEAWDRLCKRFPQHQAELRREVLESFAIHHGSPSAGVLELYELDDTGKPTDPAILKNAGNGHIRFEAGNEEGEVAIAVYFAVPWDDEHGLEVGLVDAPEEDGAAADAAARVTIHDRGPAVTAEDLAAFEKRHRVTLPQAYRDFLLDHNGGRPDPDHLQAKVPGTSLPVDVERLFSILPGGSTAEQDSLDAALARFRQQGLPGHYLPIGRVRIPDPLEGKRESPLLLGLSGQQPGKVHVLFSPGNPFAVADNPQAALMMAQMFDLFCPAVAPNFPALLSRLVPRPSQPVPEWLRAIRDDNLPRFAAWLDRGGRLTDAFTPYGEMHRLTVVDFLAREATSGFLETLLARKVLRPGQLRDSWLRFGQNLDRFKELLPLLPKDLWRCAFASPRIWDDPDFLERLVEAGVDLDGGIDDEGATPLHSAVRCGRADGVSWLLERAAKPGKADQYGRTALVWAENDRQLECLKRLLEAGESLDDLFPHMPTMTDKLKLIRSRWLDQFGELADYLRSRGLDLGDLDSR